MNSKKIITNQQFDIFDIVLLFWKEKIKIFLFVIFALIMFLVYTTFSPPKFYNANTFAYPVKSNIENQFIKLNHFLRSLSENSKLHDEQQQFLNSLTINKHVLIKEYYDTLNDPEVFLKAFKKLEILDKEKFEDEISYLDALKNLSKKVNVNLEKEAIIIQDNTRILSKTLNETTYETLFINFQFNDENIWIDILKEVDASVQNTVRNNLVNRYYEFFKTLDLIKKQRISLVQNEIDASIKTHKLNLSKKLAFLKEQAKVARKLNLKSFSKDINNEIIIETLISGEKDYFDNNYYLKGFELIEEEIKIISLRGNRNVFVPNYAENQEKISLLNSNSDIEELKKIFNETPLFKNENFKSAQLLVNFTNFKYQNDLIFKLIIVLILGTIIGMLFVLINRIKGVT